ncbi:ExbD/TolR family protein [Natroniella sp. ANB-PHB2]|uniref:ExbD/TolR family protein n=1 Tax=Natroniella sp. ANB-PHB2 TaxID=3384444 RepID=UPI0038D4B6B6
MFNSNLKKKSRIDILPMIDVIFFLLVFFMLFTTFRTTPEGLEVNLPQATTVTAQEEDLQVNVILAEDDQLYLDDQSVTEQGFSLELAKILERSPETVFVIKADQDVKYQRIIKAMDLIREAGGYRLALAANNEDLN